MKRRSFIATGSALLAAPGILRAQGTWVATRPIRFIVPWPPAGTTDILARMIAPALQEALGQNVIIENRAGAAGLIGTEAIVRADADGHAFGFIISTHAANAHLVKNHPFDAVRDITPLIHVANVHNILSINNNLPPRTVQELITWGRTNPLAFASSGTGTSTHISGEMFRLATGLSMTHVPYRGGGPALTDLMAGNVPIMFANATSALPHVRGGRIRALGVTAAQRLPFLPEAPTIAEAAIPGYQIAEWYGIVGPRGMPPAAAQRLNTLIGGIITAPEMRQKLLDSGAEVVGGTADTFGTLIANDVARYGQVIREAGITAE